MQVSVVTTKGLERKMTIQVPSEQVENEVSNRLKDIAKKVKIDGFRPGKVPLSVVKQRYMGGVRQEVAGEMVQKTLYEALQKEDLVPAGQPYVEPGELKQGEDFSYTATFEVFPEITVQEVTDNTLQHVVAEVTDADVEAMLDKLRAQHMTFEPVEDAAEDGFKLNIDFEGFIDNETFEGGTAKSFDLTLGSGSMIPGFENGLMRKKAGDETEVNVNFPDDYGHADLAGKAAVFKVKINSVSAGKKPELDDAFAEKFNISEGGIDNLRAEAKKNMVRELDRQVSQMNKETVFEALLAANDFEVPASLVDREIDTMKQDMIKRVFGDKKVDPSQVPELPATMFESQATRRVKLGLLVSEYVKQHKLSADKERVDALLEKMASAYEQPQDLLDYYRSNKEKLGELEAAALEDVVVEKITENLTLEDKSMDYDSVMNPAEASVDQEASKGEA